MNITVKTPAPDLPPRRAFDVDDIRRMIEAGVLGEDENIELVEGEIVVMAPKSYAHEMIKNALVEALFKAFAKAVDFACQRDPRIAGRLPSTKGKL